MIAKIYVGLEDHMCSVIYGSNNIEDVGTTRAFTQTLCKAVFYGEPLPECPKLGTSAYDELLKHLRLQGRRMDDNEVQQSIREVTQHAAALCFLVDQVVLDNQPITQELILETHRILCRGVKHDGQYIAGRIRDFPIAARFTSNLTGKTHTTHFIRPAAVPAYLCTMFADLQTELQGCETPRPIDPYDIAARYCHRLVNIHPFADGNGRMCRLLANVIILKYVGLVVPFGGNQYTKGTYLEVARRGAKRFWEEDGEVEEGECRGHVELRGFLRERLEEIGW